jgi:hypothetical protein
MSSPAADTSNAIPHARDLQSTTAREEVKHQLWPEAVIAFGLGLTAGWIFLLGYGAVVLGSGLVHVIRLAI